MIRENREILFCKRIKGELKINFCLIVFNFLNSFNNIFIFFVGFKGELGFLGLKGSLGI